MHFIACDVLFTAVFGLTLYPRPVVIAPIGCTMYTSCNAVWNAVKDTYRILQQQRPLCLLTESNTIFLHWWTCEAGVKIIRHIFNKGIRSRFYYVFRATLNSMHICQKKYEYVDIVYYQHFDCVVTLKIGSSISALVKSGNDSYKIGINFTNVAFWVLSFHQSLWSFNIFDDVERKVLEFVYVLHRLF